MSNSQKYFLLMNLDKHRLLLELHVMHKNKKYNSEMRKNKLEESKVARCLGPVFQNERLAYPSRISENFVNEIMKL